MSNRNQSNILAILGVLLFAALIGFGYMYFQNTELKKQLASQQENVNEIEQAKLDLEKEYHSALSDLEEMRGDNSELNKRIEEQKENLKKQKTQIASLLRNRKNLAAAKQEIAQLKTQADQYLAELTQLREENVALVASNQQLNEEKTTLSQNLMAEKEEKEELLTTKAVLIKEKDKLVETNDVLNTKVTRASVIDVNGIDVQGYKVDSNGNERKRSRARSIDKINVCINLDQNEVTDKGMEKFFIRVISPDGVTISQPELGSGVFIATDTGDEIPFTKVKEVNYQKIPTMSCVGIAPSIAWKKGRYRIEVYNKGYKAGEAIYKVK